MLPEAGKNSRYVEGVEREVARHALADWWIQPTDKTQYFVSKNVLEGGEGDMYVLAADAERKRVYRHYYFNF